ncbi:MAG: FtsW/RodA/SpoVE family cell cycle protein [Phycisphaerae bacterium]|jgi:cell division protein FtsW|nr:FtsW/RodA/SpoVE family cell cycle protein [Phycisphaerae bacterium]
MRAGQGIVVISITLLMLGVVMVNSAGMQVSQDPLSFEDMLASRPTMLAFFAILAMFIGSRFPLHFFEKRLLKIPLVLWLLPLSVLLLFCVYMPSIGREVNYSSRWVTFGAISFQPSEVAKWSMVLIVAWWGSNQFQHVGNFWRGFVLPISGIGVIAAIIAVEDLGTAVLIFTVACLVLFASGAKLLHFATLVPIAIAGFAFAVITSPYRIARLQAYLHPFDDPEQSGYHILQSMSTISGGGLFGLGLGNGIHKFGYLPEDTTDFIFSVICEELGLIGAIAVASLYIGLVVLGVCVIRKTKSAFLQLIAFGVVVTVGLQACMNILVVTALIPTKGIALPLLSNGGTGWLLTAFCIGLIDAIDRKNDTVLSMHTHHIDVSTPSHA